MDTAWGKHPRFFFRNDTFTFPSFKKHILGNPHVALCPSRRCPVQVETKKQVSRVGSLVPAFTLRNTELFSARFSIVVSHSITGAEVTCCVSDESFLVIAWWRFRQPFALKEVFVQIKRTTVIMGTDCSNIPPKERVLGELSGTSAVSRCVSLCHKPHPDCKTT